ncbi:LysR family transcriptional regulator [Otariodibacter sp.]|uniref:LysR family transcriptional regulator n=1 Tax=Otariodibacter sp. TaxID=3030919 RepID=UPI0026380ECD|nr:LysR family transcriptional regulator [Otariodibacter sp.]
MDKLNAINLFCRVIETQSFTQAAQQEKISLAMASKLVAQLEEHLNVRLLQRTTRKITPTEAGLLFYQRCQPILTELRDAEACISNTASSLHGTLRISVPMDFSSRFIAPNLGGFMETYPNIKLDIEFTDRRVDVIAEGYDLVLRIGKLEDSSLVAKRIAQAEHAIVASPAYLEEYGTPTSIEELDDHQCLIYGEQNFWLFNDNGVNVKCKLNGKIHSNNGQSLVKMAKAGLGIINVPKFLVKDEIMKGRLIAILPHLEQEKLDISLLYPHRRYLSPKVKVAIEFLSKLMDEQREYL